jgi:hypothetical protein
MILIHDRETAARALALTLTPPIRAALLAELALLTAGEHDLTAHTHILLIAPGDAEVAVEREAGVNPLVDTLSGARAGEPGFEPGFDLLTLRGGVFRLVFTFGSTHATILLVPDAEGVWPDLLAMCRSRAAHD